MKMISIIGNAVVLVIGLLMVTKFMGAGYVAPPVLSGMAFSIIGAMGLWHNLP